MRCCTLFSGSSGNTVFVDSGNTKILIDAGVSAKKIGESLGNYGVSLSDIDAILVTHEHVDHVASVGYLSKKFDISIFASKLTWDKIPDQLAKMTSLNCNTFSPDDGFDVGDLEIMPFNIPHDAVEPCGFSIFNNNKKITVATDIGHMNAYLIDNLKDSDLLLLESNHDVEMLKCSERYPWVLKKRILGDNGHLSNEMAGKTVTYLAKSGMKNFILGHLSKENNFPELAYQTVHSMLQETGAVVGQDVMVEVAPANCASNMWEI